MFFKSQETTIPSLSKPSGPASYTLDEDKAASEHQI